MQSGSTHLQLVRLLLHAYLGARLALLPLLVLPPLALAHLLLAVARLALLQLAHLPQSSTTANRVSMKT